MKKRPFPLPLCLLLLLFPLTARAAEAPSAAVQTNFLLYASVASAGTARSLADALLQHAAAWEDLVPPADPGRLCYPEALALFDRINEAREAHSLPALTLSQPLTDQAEEQAAEQLHTLTQPLGRFRRLSNGPDLRALGPATPAAALRTWLYTPEARAMLLNADNTQAGIGCFLQNGTYSWVVLLRSDTKYYLLLPPGGLHNGLVDGPVPSRGE